MATRPRQLTAEDLYAFPDDGNRYELVEGELITMPPAGYGHGRVELTVGSRLLAFVRERGLGEVVVGDVGFVLARRPDTVLAPDVAFVRRDRVPPPGQEHKFAELAPDLAVEVVSPSDRQADVAAKARRWVQAGVRVVWVVHPERRTVTVYEPGDLVTVIGEDGDIDGGELLPGFRVAVSELFG